MINWVLEFWGNTYFAVLCYWMPMVVCFVGYILRTNENYQEDVKNRNEYQEYVEAKEKFESMLMSEEDFRRLYPEKNHWNLPSYRPTDTYGSLLGRALLTIVPIANIFAAIFDVSPKLFRNLFDWISKVFDTPIVPPPPEHT